MPTSPTMAYPASEPSGLRRVAPEHRLYPLAGRAAPWFGGAAALLCALALYLGFFSGTGEAGQGAYDRILLIHVPACWLALGIYVALAGAAAAGLFLERRLFAMIASALAPTGAMFAFLGVWTGALWGKPSWGSWWSWEPGLAGLLVLLCLFCAIVALQAALEDVRGADAATALVALFGLAALPLTYFAVEHWSDGLHGASLALSLQIGTSRELLVGTLAMTAALSAYTAAAALTRLRTVILERERRSEWVRLLTDE